MAGHSELKTTSYKYEIKEHILQNRKLSGPLGTKPKGTYSIHNYTFAFLICFL